MFFKIRYYYSRQNMQKLLQYFVGVPGLEPGLTEPKSVVLPLHHTPKCTPYIHIPGVRTTKIYQLCTKNGKYE